MTRLKRKRMRILKEVKFYLEVVKNGEWVGNNDICQYLEYSTRGQRSYNSISSSTLGQYMKSIQCEKRETCIGNDRLVEYRILRGEEE